MTQGLRDELAEMVGPVEWHWLKPHISRDVVVIVDPQLDILDVGVALANDNVQAVQRWIGEQLIVKPTPEQLQTWNNEEPVSFQTLIVQPYVLIQDRGEASSPDQTPTP